MRNFIVFLLFSIASAGVFAKEPNEICASTFQSFWLLNFKTGSLQLKAFYRHPETIFCEVSMTEASNVEITILDASKNSIRKFNSYISTKNYQDVTVNDQMHGSIKNIRSAVIQIKFADDSDFKKAKFIKMIFADGSVYGPASF